MIDGKLLKKLYKQYGFEQQKSSNEKILVFSLMAGHYHNVDIVPLDRCLNTDKIFDEYKASGFACKIRNYDSISNAEEALFNGFFSLESTQRKFKKDYEHFTQSIAKLYSEHAEYSYINSKYHVNEKEGESTVIKEVLSRLNSDKPVLFLIEAAAGFGKTCTAYEILHHLVTSKTEFVPLFTELSRNRQAKIFRYVLLDEIDRSFPSLRSTVVNNEIRNGKVPVILDGFDELLHESSADEGFENSEPMLETIGELLTDKAKIILTTRRTAIFDGDEFHQWMDVHEKDFDVVRIRIHEPTVSEWLDASRITTLSESGFNVHELSNPVLLSYLRSINNEEFVNVVSTPEKLVQKYFDSMLERERTRQDLRMTPEEQYEVLLSIARDMMTYNYTGEEREYILTVILDANQEKIEKIRKDYPADVRPTSDEIANKLASHALLDRSSDEEQGIGFVNDFVLGNFCAEIIIEHPEKEWVGDKRFIEPSILSYIPRTSAQKSELWDALSFTLEFGEGNAKVINSIALNNNIILALEDDSVEDLKIGNIEIGDKAEFKGSIFVNCVFNSTKFFWKSFKNVTFMNCHFFNCEGFDEPSTIHLVSCDTNNNFLLDKITHQKEIQSKQENAESLSAEECFVLEKFWPKGRPTFSKHKAVKAIVQNHNSFSHESVLEALDSLKRRGYLTVPAKRSFLELNIGKLTEIKEKLGRS